ncbi:flap endonuclease 1-like [Scleropages formosus]|uniref:Flap endonuclease 1 n=1 Tax=Scleropages formosus TaxID=113540 RepID=A0A0P7WCX3_SCLFO|nr:flap endonuclease 1-like [Scleropages formosus]
MSVAMGIHGLAKLVADQAPSAIKEHDIKSYFGRKIAIDASMSIYQFLIAVRQDGNMLQNEDGETTSHLMGMFYRTIRMLESGIKPVYVFDGKPPQLKSGELTKRGERRAEAEKLLAQAQETGEQENIDKFSKRLVKVTKQHNDECKKLLTLMGVPYIEAPCEAEASCAALVKAGKVFATATEDMDGLTFGTNVLLRHLTASEAKKLPIQEYHFSRILQDMALTHEQVLSHTHTRTYIYYLYSVLNWSLLPLRFPDHFSLSCPHSPSLPTQFIDLCILLGCDYCGTIKGVGPKRAMDLIRQHGSIEKILDNIDLSKYPAPEDWLYKEARELFREPEVVNCNSVELKWSEPDEEGLVQFMCTEKQFSEDRIRNGCKKILKSRQGSTQGRLDTFFTITGSLSSKRKEPEVKGSAKKKQKTSATPGKFKKGK